MVAMNLKALALVAILTIVACNDDEDNSSDAPCNCGDVTAASSYTVGEGRLYVPNAFTPNADGINDEFYPRATEGIERLLNFSMEDKDGNDLASFQAIEPNDPVLSWPSNGATTYDGKIRYTITAQSTNGEVKTITGTACSIHYATNAVPAADLEDCGKCRFLTQYDGFGGFDENLPSFEEICK